MSTTTHTSTTARSVLPAPTLRVVDGPLAGTVLHLEAQTATVGRRRDNTYVLADPTVSRVHARLTREAGAVVVTDLGSTAGTTLNGTPVEDAVVVHHGDQVGLGSVTLVCEDPAQLVADEQPTEGFAVPEPDTDPQLSPRQQQVLEGIADGLTNGEIGGRLGITERTVKAYAADIYTKLDAANRAQAVARAVDHGLL